MARFRDAFFLLFTMLASWSATAQQITGTIRGTVVDPSGAVAQAATISATQTDTGLTRVAKTDGAGVYVLLELPVGHYELQVEAKGFQKYI